MCILGMVFSTRWSGLAGKMKMGSAWNFTDGTAQTQWANCSAAVNPTDATRPTQLKSSDWQPWEVFSIAAQPKHTLDVEEAYARGDDLIVQYAQADGDSYQFHLYWRNLPAKGEVQCSLELWLGVQTGLLDSQPELHVSCNADSDSWKAYSHGDLAEDGSKSDSLAGLVCSRQDGVGVWLIEPSDQCDVTRVKNENAGGATVAIFDHFMEKGVIRRGRMRFHVMQASASLADFKAAYQDFAASELPLTA